MYPYFLKPRERIVFIELGLVYIGILPVYPLSVHPQLKLILNL